MNLPVTKVPIYSLKLICFYLHFGPGLLLSEKCLNAAFTKGAGKTIFTAYKCLCVIDESFLGRTRDAKNYRDFLCTAWKYARLLNTAITTV